jgi:UDPglucose 6-dehydrogenase
LTEWDEFKIPNFKLIKKYMKGNIILDGRNLWDKQDALEAEMIYE